MFKVFGKCEAHYIIRYLLSWMNSGETVTCRDVNALKNANMSQQLRCPSSHPSIQRFIQAASVTHPPIYTIIHPRVKPSNLSACQQHQNKQPPLWKKSLQNLKGNLTYPHATCLPFIQNCMHTHKYAKWKQEERSLILELNQLFWGLLQMPTLWSNMLLIWIESMVAKTG